MNRGGTATAQRRESGTGSDFPQSRSATSTAPELGACPRFPADLPGRTRASLLAGALGDALGAPIEFLTLAEIRERFGPAGLTRFAPAYGRLGAITDDTQMTLFTAEGLLRAQRRKSGTGSDFPQSPPVTPEAPEIGTCPRFPALEALHHAYLRWLHTQGVAWKEIPASGSPTEDPDGYLLRHPFLHARRAPGNTCLSALESPRFGTREAPLNDSKGCGGVMRAAPCGVVARDPAEAFALGADSAALTHGHPTGYLAAGAFAATIWHLLRGEPPARAVAAALHLLAAEPESHETVAALEGALALARQGAPSPETVERLGRGWIAEEALAIAVYTLLTAPDLRTGLLLAVNHSGDSDSTGAIAGNLLGAAHGPAELPADLLEHLEGREVIETLATDLARLALAADDAELPEEWDERYPPW